MKKAFSKWIQTLTTTTSETSTKKRGKGGKKSSAPQSKKLALECLEDRCLLSITFNPLEPYTYQPSGVSAISLGLGNTDFLDVAKISSRGNDIVSINQNLQTVSVFLNQGNGKYGHPTTGLPETTVITGPGLGSLEAKYALVDMNGDGIADLLVFYPKQVAQGGQGGTRTDLFVDVYTGMSNGKFETAPKTSQIANPFTWTGTDNVLVIDNVQVRDVTGDNRPDLLITLTGTSYASSPSISKTESLFCVGIEGSKFSTTAHTVPTPTVPSGVTVSTVGLANLSAGTSPWQLVCQTETVITGSRNVQTLYFSNTTISTSSGITTPSPTWKKEYTPATTLWTKIANVDQRPGDNIVTGIQYVNNNVLPTYAVRVSTVTTLSSSNTTAEVNASTIDVDIEPRFSAIGNFTGSSFVDILISDGNSYQLLVGTSSGFTAQSKVDSFANYLAVQAWDFNGDGYQDIVAIGEKHLMLLPGTPTSPFYGQWQIIDTFSAKVTSAVFGDFNGDGCLDFVVAYGDAGTTLTLYTGLAPGGSSLFSRFVSIKEARSPSVLVTGNFITPKVTGAQNPKTDLAVLHGGGTEILVLSFNGLQVTSKSTKLPDPANSIVHIAAGDFNRDGYDDIITVNEINATVTILHNKGGSAAGEFDLNSTSITVGTPLNTQTGQGSRPSFVAVADINGDSRLDFAVLNAGDNAVLFYTQNSNGTFSPNTATPRINDLNLKANTRYQMIFEDFDQDERIDLLVGVTGSNQAVIFQNKGTQPGQFLTDTPNRIYIPANTGSTLEGSLDNKTVFAMSTGFKTGPSSGHAAKTPGIILVSGNKIYAFENKTPSEASPALMEIAFRERRTVALLPLYNAQYNVIPPGSAATNDPKLEWLHEWGQYYLEVWGSSGSAADSISSFSCTISYDKSLFSVVSTDIEKTSYFTLTKTTVDVSAGQIIVTGNANSSGIGRNQYVLLFRVLVTPASRNGVSLPATGYATPVSSGFRFAQGAQQINSKNLVNLKDGLMMPVYPVIYDLNDKDDLNMNDFFEFAMAYRKRNESPNMKIDFNGDGAINMNDFFSFAMAYRQRNAPYFLHSFFPEKFPSAWPQLTVTPAPAIAMATPLEEIAVPGEEFLEPIVPQDADTVIVLTNLLSDDYLVTADMMTAESDSVDIKSTGFTFSAESRFEFAATTSHSIAELDTLGYVARTESVTNHERKRVETLDQVLGNLFQEEEDALTLEEISRIAEQPFESLRLTDQILAELV